MIVKFLKYRLPKWKSKDYIRWMKERCAIDYEVHHVLKRQYGDFFLVNIPRQTHRRVHSIGYEPLEQEGMIVEAFGNVQRYITYLEGRNG